MGLFKLRFKCHARITRGSVDAPTVIEALKETWDDLQEALNNMEESERE